MSSTQINGKQIKDGTITQQKLDFLFDANTLPYENEEPVPLPLGGVLSGTTFPSGTTINDVLNLLLYPFVSASINLTPLNIFEKGLISPTNITLTGNITFNSEENLDISIRRGLTTIYNESGISNPYNINFTDSSPQTATVTYTISVFGIENSSKEVTATFVAPSYYGVLSGNASENEIKSLGKNLFLPDNKTLSFTPLEQRFYFAYPSSFGELSKIKDQNGFDITDDFILRVENFTMEDSTIESYNIYEFNSDTTQTNFLILFEF